MKKERMTEAEANELVRREQGSWRCGRGIPFPLRAEILADVEIVEPAKNCDMYIGYCPACGEQHD